MSLTVSRPHAVPLALSLSLSLSQTRFAAVAPPDVPDSRLPLCRIPPVRRLYKNKYGRASVRIEEPQSPARARRRRTNNTANGEKKHTEVVGAVVVVVVVVVVDAPQRTTTREPRPTWWPSHARPPRRPRHQQTPLSPPAHLPRPHDPASDPRPQIQMTRARACGRDGASEPTRRRHGQAGARGRGRMIRSTRPECLGGRGHEARGADADAPMGNGRWRVNSGMRGRRRRVLLG